MITAEESHRLIGAMVVDSASDRIGEVRQVFVDAETDSPAWVGVRVGLFGGEVLVPLEGADWDERSLHAAVTRSSARSAPEIDLDEPLSVEEHERVCRHYGIPSVRHPREPMDPDLFEDETVSYSVNDGDMADDVQLGPDSDDETALIEQRELSSAMDDAAAQSDDGVSGHMLVPTPEPLDAPHRG